MSYGVRQPRSIKERPPAPTPTRPKQLPLLQCVGCGAWGNLTHCQYCGVAHK